MCLSESRIPSELPPDWGLTKSKIPALAGVKSAATFQNGTTHAELIETQTSYEIYRAELYGSSGWRFPLEPEKTFPLETPFDDVMNALLVTLRNN
jgi:hypothetical protein